MLYLAFAWQIAATVASDSTFFFGLAAMLPLAAAWVVSRIGPGAVAPIASLSLLPSLSLQATDWISTALQPSPLALLLLGVVGGGWHAARRQAWLWDGLIRPARLWWALPAFCLLTLVRYEVPPLLKYGAGFGIGFDPFGSVAMGLLVAIVDWGVLARRTHELTRGRAPWVLPQVGRHLPLALTVGFGLRFSFGVAGIGVGWGGASAEALAVALALVVLLTGAVPWRRCLVVAAALFAVEAVRFAAVARPLGMLFSEAKYAGTPQDLVGLACDLVCAALLAGVLRAHAMASERNAMGFVALALTGIVAVQFGVKPAIQPPWSGEFNALAPGGWLIGGAAFAAALYAGGSAVVAVPLLFAVAAAVGAAAFGKPDAGPMPAVATAVGVATVAAMYAFLGWLLARRQDEQPAAASGPDDRLDVSRLAAFVHRLDTSATLRSFGALLAVAGGALALAHAGVFAALWQRIKGFDDFAPGEIALAASAVLFVALLPLGFIIVDAINRRDLLRPLAALSGALLAALAGGLVVVGTTMAYVLVTDADGVGRDRLSGLAVLAVATALGLGLLARGIRLRADLTIPVPRGMLFGEIGDGGLWARLACLMGMPSSLWQRAALGDAAFWALLLSRPVLYLGVWAVWQGQLVFGIALVIGAHALFVGGKRRAAREIWRVGHNDGAAPVLFLRSFEDDQFDFGSRTRHWWRQWLELWSFRRNLDETLVDEVARYGKVVALGNPGDKTSVFGALRHRSNHDDWQRVVTDTARRAHTIVIAAGDTPGVLWEYALLAREKLLDRSVLLFRPGQDAQAANRAALAAFLVEAERRAAFGQVDGKALVALLHMHGEPVLLVADSAQPAAYVLALRTHFQRQHSAVLREAARRAP